MKKLKWGFIGCGEVTETKSGPAFNEVEGSEVVAVMSRNGKKARSYAERHGVKKWYTDAQELIDDPEVNAIYIATFEPCHLCQHGHARRQTGVCGKTTGCQL